MKKINAILASMLLLAACAQQEKMELPIKCQSPVFTASLEDGVTKTYLNGERKLVWNASDRVSIYTTTSTDYWTNLYEYTGEEGSTGGEFNKLSSDQPAGSPLNANYAVYPGQIDDISISEEGVISLNMPDGQWYDFKNSFSKGANTMVAVTSSADDHFLAFKNLCGYLVVKLYGEGEVYDVTLKGNNGEKISGAATVTARYGEDPVVTMAETANDYINFVAGHVYLSPSADEAREFWFCIPPVTFEKGFTVTATNVQGWSMVLTVSDSKTIERNVIHTMPAVEADFNVRDCHVFFNNSEETELKQLKKDQETVSVELCRPLFSEECTVNISSVDENNLFDIPETVTFAPYDSKADLVIGVPFDKIEMGKDYEITLAIDPVQANPLLGCRTTKTVIIRYDEWSGWELLDKAPGNGWGCYTYDLYWSGQDDLKIYSSQSNIDSKSYKFKIENWGNGVNLEFTYDESTGLCHMPETYIGVDDSRYGPVYVRESIDYDPNCVPVGQSYFVPETGTFYLNLTYYVDAGFFGNGYETFQLEGYHVPDYSVTVEYRGVSKNASEEYSAVLGINIGADGESPDVSAVKVAICEGADPDPALDGILDGTVSAVVLTESGECQVPFPAGAEGGYFTAVAVSMDHDGLYRYYDYVTFEEYFGDNPWKSAGFFNYTDDIVGSLFGEDPVTYPVEVLTNENMPGLYRMKNPYGAGFPYNYPGDYLETDVFVDIDASNPEEVTIREQSLGVDWGYGIMYAASLEPGTLADGKITFPIRGLAVYDNDGGYYANKNGAFCLDLSTQVNVESSSVQNISAKPRVREMSASGSLGKMQSKSKPLPKMRLGKDIVPKP